MNWKSFCGVLGGIAVIQCNDSYRVNETYIKIRGRWKYLYRAVDSAGNTLEFLLSSRRDKKAAKRFFKKMLGNNHATKPK